MKLTEIKADGTVYWFERGNDWGQYVNGTAYDRHPCTRVDDQRYQQHGFNWRYTYSQSDKGRYVKVQPLTLDGKPEGEPRYVLSAQVRDTFEAVKERAKVAGEAKARDERLRKDAADAAHQRAKALRHRLSAAGLLSLFNVNATEGYGYHAAPPHVNVDFADGFHADEALEKVLDLLAAEFARGKAAAEEAAFNEGQLVNDAQRDQALGYVLRPEQAAALRRAEGYDPDFADRLTGGAYDK